MKKLIIPIIIGVTAALAIGISFAGIYSDEPIIENSPTEIETVRDRPNAVTSGPLTITKYEHKITENIFLIIDGLDINEKGNIRIFMPDGRLYKTINYDGSQKNSFNIYFKPDVSKFRKICEQEELAGIWLVKFDKNVYPSVEFEILNEHFEGPNKRLPKSC